MYLTFLLDIKKKTRESPTSDVLFIKLFLIKKLNQVMQEENSSKKVIGIYDLTVMSIYGQFHSCEFHIGRILFILPKFSPALFPLTVAQSLVITKDWMIEVVVCQSSHHLPSTFVSCGPVKIFLHLRLKNNFEQHF